jgi:hypothetical protein
MQQNCAILGRSTSEKCSYKLTGIRRWLFCLTEVSIAMMLKLARITLTYCHAFNEYLIAGQKTTSAPKTCKITVNNLVFRYFCVIVTLSPMFRKKIFFILEHFYGILPSPQKKMTTVPPPKCWCKYLSKYWWLLGNSSVTQQNWAILGCYLPPRMSILKNIFPRSQKRPRNEDRGTLLRPRETIFQVQTDLTGK